MCVSEFSVDLSVCVCVKLGRMMNALVFDPLVCVRVRVCFPTEGCVPRPEPG